MASFGLGSRLGKFIFFLLLLIYFVYLVVARAPASWAAWAVQEAVPGVWLSGVSGTVWEGRAAGGTAVVGGQRMPIEDVRWDVHPWRLLSLNLCADMEAQLAGQPTAGKFCRGPNDLVRARDLQVSAPMEIVSDWLQVDLAGQASLQVQEAELQGPRVTQLSGNLSWRDARVHDGEQWARLGAFAADLAPSPEGGVRAEIFELDGPFSVELTGDFRVGREPQINGTVTANEGAPPQIRQALELLAEPLGDGRYRIVWPPGT